MKIDKYPILAAAKINVTFTILMLCTQLSYSQSNQLIFDHFGLTTGFTAKEAKDVVTSKNGMVWISSNNGLVRYDSKRFKFYQHIQGDSNSITANLCTYLETDNRGRIWISCKDNLEVFDPVTEKFSHIQIPYNYKKTKWLKTFDINLQYDAQRDIMWIPTKNGLFFSKGGSLKISNVSIICNDTTLISDPVFSVLPAEANNLWVASGLKFIKLNTQSGAVEKYTIPKKINDNINDEKYSYIRCMWLDKNQTLWLGTWRNGLVAYNTVDKKFSQYLFSSSTTNTVYDIKQVRNNDKNELLYLSTFGNGFCTFDIATRRFKSYKSAFTADNGGIRGDTYSINTDISGLAVWIGSENGLYKLDFTRQLFKSIDLSSLANGSNLIPVNVIAIEKTGTGIDEKVWIKIPDKGTYICNLLNCSISPTPARLKKYIENSFDFFGFFIDSRNRLWINNNKYGLICYDIRSDKMLIEGYKYFFENSTWLICFFEDKTNRLWFGTRNGLFYMDESAKAIVSVPQVNESLQKENLATAIQGITEDRYSNLWYATGFSNKKNAAIVKYNPSEKKGEVIFSEIKKTGLLAKPADFSGIAVTQGNKVFISDNNNGLLWLPANETNPVLRKAPANSTLHSNVPNAIIADKDNIWCNTDFGIAHYNANKETYTNYSYADYAIGTKMKPAIYLSGQSGNLYIGQSNAINYLNAGLLNVGSNTSSLIFTEIRLFDSVYCKDGKTPVDGDNLIFTHGQNTVSVEFALLSYTNSNGNLYSWKLEGLEKDWNTSKNNIATYYQLNPGNYTLLVKAANNNGIWSAKIIKLHIIIKSPFYATWWFILISLACVIGVLYYFTQQKIKRIRDKYQLRNKIASDLHDEIGSTLTSISILSDVSQQAMELKPLQAREMLQQIALQSKNIQQSMSDIVWSIRPDNEKIENLVVRMREFAAHTLEPLNIDASITAEESIIEQVLPMQYRKDILLIYKEAINNITKHANATTVKILITNGKGKIILSITDNGKWKGNNSGTGTKTMQERAKAMGGQLTLANTEAGTQILLTVPVT